MKRLRTLFKTFFFLGFLTFGGGIAMLPSIKQKAINARWIDEPTWSHIVTLSQLFPGAIAVNVAHLIGYQVKGKWGSFVSVIGMVLPSFLVILAVALFLQPFLDHPLVEGALQGVLIAVSLLMFRALLDLAKSTRWHTLFFIILVVTLLILYLNVLSPLMVLFITSLLTALYVLVRPRA